MSCSRVAINAMAFALPFTAASMIAGGLRYSLNRSAHLLSTSECTRITLPEMSPAFLKSAVVPMPTSTTGMCCAINGGPSATETARALNTTGGIELNFGSVEVPIDETVTTVAPSAHEFGNLNVSV